MLEPKGGIHERGIPWVIHQKRSPAVCWAVWGARRSAGRRSRRAPPRPSPAPGVPWETAPVARGRGSPSAVDAARDGTDGLREGGGGATDARGGGGRAGPARRRRGRPPGGG